MASRKTNKTTESFMSKGTDPRKKPKTQSSLALIFGNNAFLLSSLRKTHTGKRILLRAKDIYSGTVPAGEEAFLFQYSVSHVNADCKIQTWQHNTALLKEWIPALRSIAMFMRRI